MKAYTPPLREYYWSVRTSSHQMVVGFQKIKTPKLQNSKTPKQRKERKKERKLNS
jgi:hypothetical protein